MLRALQASDFDYKNINARGCERLAELTDALTSVPGAEKAIPEMFSVMERLPDSDVGSRGPLVHALERWRDYEPELVNSVCRRRMLPALNRIPIGFTSRFQTRRRFAGSQRHCR